MQYVGQDLPSRAGPLQPGHWFNNAHPPYRSVHPTPQMIVGRNGSFRCATESDTFIVRFEFDGV